MTESLSIALWAMNIGRPLAGLDPWVAEADARMAEAAAAGADLLVMPEYACEQWVGFAPEGLLLGREIPWMAAQAAPALEALATLPERHGIALLAGTMPWPVAKPTPGAPAYTNRAWLLLPDGRRIAQDKLCLTPAERNPRGWNLGTGRHIEIVEWRGVRLATLICLDVELAAASAALTPHAVDLLLVPSQTTRASGYHRVFDCAKARAVELQAVVCAVGCIGAAAGRPKRGGNTSGAAVFQPCEPELGHHGVIASVPPRAAVEGAGPLLIARDLPIAQCRRLRAGAAEVWPGAWSGAHLEVRHASVDPAAAA